MMCGVARRDVLLSVCLNVFSDRLLSRRTSGKLLHTVGSLKAKLCFYQGSWQASFHWFTGRPYFLRASFSTPEVLQLLRCSLSADNHALQIFVGHLKSAISKTTNSALFDIQWLQTSMPITYGSLGWEGCHRSQFLSFWHQLRVPFPSRKTSFHHHHHLILSKMAQYKIKQRMKAT